MKYILVQRGESGKAITKAYDSLEEANSQAESIWAGLPELTKEYLHIFVTRESEITPAEGGFDSKNCDKLKIERLIAEYIEKCDSLSDDEKYDFLVYINDTLEYAWSCQRIPLEFFMKKHKWVYSQ